MNDDSDDLPRAFGFWSGAALVAASMIGSGILVTPGYAAAGLGSHVAGVILWIVGGVLAFCGALTLAEMASAIPKVGGEYVYVEKALGPTAGFTYGWATLVIGFVGPTASVALLSAKFLLQGLPEAYAETFTSPDCVCTPGLACALIVLFTIVHCLGQQRSAWVQNATTLFKYATLAGFAVLGIAYGFRAGSWNNLWELASVGSETQVASLWDHVKALAVMPTAAAGALVFMGYSYIGWNGAAYVAGEMREAPRMVPRSILAGCLGVMALYVAIALAFAAAFSVQEIRGMTDAQKDTIALAAFQKAVPHPATKIAFSWIVGLGLIATLSAFLFTGSRVVLAMARTGHFFPIAGSWNARRNAPVLATLILGVPSAAMVWYAKLDELINFLGIGLTGLGVMFAVSIFVLRRQPDYRPVYRVPLYPLPPLVYLGSCLFILGMKSAENWKQPLLAVGVILLGVPVHLLVRMAARKEGSSSS
jgi:APA family basic amino acid/polyamine antiporter